ncbi:MAG: hypothetical protein ABI035_07415 [Gemmatimonadaceae bacterium]
MATGLGRWRGRIIAGACAVYAGAVALIGFAPALVATWRFTRPSAGHGVASVSADNTLMMHIKFTSTALPTWTGSVNLGTLLLWMLGPPIFLWLAWLASGPRHPHFASDRQETSPEAIPLKRPDFESSLDRRRERQPEKRDER